MRSYGCYDALDFDGGGSTLMWDAMEGTINRPCVSPERAVGNGIFAVLHAPDDEEVAEIRFADYAVRMPRYGSYRPAHVLTPIDNCRKFVSIGKFMDKLSIQVVIIHL